MDFCEDVGEEVLSEGGGGGGCWVVGGEGGGVVGEEGGEEEGVEVLVGAEPKEDSRRCRGLLLLLVRVGFHGDQRFQFHPPDNALLHPL